MYVFYQVKYSLTMSLSPTCIIQLRCSPTKAQITPLHVLIVITADSKGEEG